MVTKPKQKFDNIVQLGLKAHSLATQHGMAERLPAGMLDGLAASIASLGVLVPGAGKARNDAKTATKSQKVVLQQAYWQLRAVRSLASASPNASVRSAYTVGDRTDPKLVGSVAKALRRVIERATNKPEEARALGILEADVEALRSSLATIVTTDEEQSRKIATLPERTRDRNVEARRILEAVDRIAASGMLRYVGDPRGVEFEALLRRPGRPRAQEDAGQEAPPPPA